MAELLDEEWLRKSFLVPTYNYEEQEKIRREMTEAKYKFTDTTLGGNYAINPPPQFTRTADMRVRSRFSGSTGQGRYYSEAIDDRGQLVHMRFGIPAYNSLTNFFFNFYNPQAASLANRGRVDQLFYYIGRVLGFVVSLPAQPFILVGSVVKYLLGKPTSRYYYLKPNMPAYWSAVNNIANAIGVNMGLVGRGLSLGDQALRKEDPVAGGSGKHQESGEIYRYMRGAYSNIYRADGGVDVFAMATRAKRLEIAQHEAMRKAVENSGSWDSLITNMREAVSKQMTDNGGLFKSANDYIKRFHGSDTNKPETAANGDPIAYGEAVGQLNENVAKDSGFVDFLEAELKHGASFVTFRVDNQGTVNESFNNSIGESQVSSMINSASAAGRQASFTFAGGNVAEFLKPAIDAARSVVTGVLQSVKMSGLLALAGSAYADFPKVWENSTASLPSASYTIELRSPYGAPLARYQNLIIPLAMLLAGVLPIATGKQSYTSPFLCELYCRGRQQIRLGMIESLSVTRGTGNLGWTRDGQPLGIDVSFSVVDMSSVMHMPITSNYGILDAGIDSVAKGVDKIDNSVSGALSNVFGLSGTVGNDAQTAQDLVTLLSKSTYDDDNAFTDYMAVLGSLSLSDQIFPTNKFRLRRAQRMAAASKWRSPAFHANWMAGTLPGRVASIIINATGAQETFRGG